MTSARCRVSKWKATPGATRPARPLRCFKFALGASASCSELILRSGSYLFSLCRAVSTTNPTSSIVTDVSATFVDSTILRHPVPYKAMSGWSSKASVGNAPGGGRLNTSACSSCGSVPCSGMIQLLCGSSSNGPFGTSSNAFRNVSISFTPGRNTRIASIAPPPPALTQSARVAGVIVIASWIT
eukprot:31379-Pelagococcus_subviridis.AAC.23